MSTILIVLSAADHWTLANGEKYESGYWAGEFVDIDERLVNAGCTVDVATPGGVKPTAETASTPTRPARTRRATASISTRLATSSISHSCSPTSTLPIRTRSSFPAETDRSRTCSRIAT